MIKTIQFRHRFFSRVVLCFILCFTHEVFAQKRVGQFEEALNKISAAHNDQQKLKAIIDYTALQGGDFARIIFYGDSGKYLARKIGDSVALGKLYNNTGIAQYFMGRYDDAANALFYAVKLLEQANQDTLLPSIYNDLGKLFRKTGDYTKSIQYYEQALQNFTRQGNLHGQQIIWNESGVVYEYLDNMNEAIQRYQKSLGIAKLRQDSIGIGYAWNFLAGAYSKQKKYALAKIYLDSAFAIRNAMKDSFALALTYTDAAELYAAMGDLHTADSMYKLSNRLAFNLQIPDLIGHNYESLAFVNKSLGKLEEAFAYLQEARKIKDSLFSLHKAREITELETRYQTEKKEQQLLRQELELTSKNYFIFLVSILLVSVVVVGYAYYRRYRTRQEIKLREALLHQQRAAMQAVLDAEEKERHRIAQELHDGIGQMMGALKLNLSGLRSELPNEDPMLSQKLDNIYELVDDSCREIRNVSHQMLPNTLLRYGLTGAVKDFMNKIDMQTLDAHVYMEGIDKRLNANVEHMMFRVVQECVTNVIKHAQASRLDISLILEERELVLIIEDNGCGFDTSVSAEGIGLKNIYSRVAYLNGSVELDSKPGKGTVISIAIPLED